MSVAERVEGLLAEAVEAVLAAEPETLDPDELHRLVTVVLRGRDRLTVAAADSLRTWDGRRDWQADGSRNAPLALSKATRCSTRTAERELARARRHDDVARSAEAVLDGRLSVDHLDLLARAAIPARRELFERDEELLIDQCAHLPLFSHAVKAVRYWMAAADDELGRGGDASPPSRLYASRLQHSGEGILEGTLSAVDTEIVFRELTRLEQQLKLDDRRDHITRTPAERRAAALVAMAGRSLSSDGPTARPLLQIVVGDATARWLCETSSGQVLRPADLLPLLSDAVFETFLFDGPSIVLSKTKTRTFRGALRRAIQVRDRHCQDDSACDATIDECDVDHILPWAQGGETDQDNGRLGCRTHNRHPELRDRASRVVAARLRGWQIKVITLDELRRQIKEPATSGADPP